MAYQAEGVPLLILAGKEYGTGSSRDWAAKGTSLLGVKAVLAESFERIHRSNLVGMGVLPLQFQAGDSPESLGLTGRETFDVVGNRRPAGAREEPSRFGPRGRTGPTGIQRGRPPGFTGGDRVLPKWRNPPHGPRKMATGQM